MLGDLILINLKKNFKKKSLLNVLRLITVIMILCTTIFPTFTRADSKTIVVKLWIGNPFMSVNDVRQPIDSQGTKPIIVESRTLVPIRAIIEAFGGEVSWDSTARKVTINFNNNTLELWIGQSTASLNGYATQIDPANPKVVPMIINGRTMLPLRFVAESFGIDVQYDAASKMITLTYVSETTPVVQIPSAPLLVSPTDNSTLNNSNITFTWTVVSGADLYRLRIIKDGSTLNSFESINTNSYTLTGITLEDGTYSWQVAAHNSAGWGPWSASFSFSISKQMSVTDIAKFVDRVVYIKVSGYKNGEQFTGSGSGFVISSDGKIVTNYHVINGATSGTVTLNDGTKYDIVSVLGYGADKQFGDKDLAVIKINASNLPVCALGDSDKVQVGESVVAIGSPLGLQNTVSNGIISKIWDNGLIQITAPTSKGSSGGPLFNMYGEVIGINTYGLAPIGGENINVALPINWLKKIDTSLNMTLEQVYQKEYGFIPSIPGTPTLISPADGSVLTITTPTLTWTAAPGADYYGVAVMEGPVKDQNKIIWIASSTTTSITIPAGKLQTGKIYTWVVVARNSYGYGKDSDAWHFSISVPQLTPPVLLSPDDEKSVFPSVVNHTLSFNWSPVAGASSYTLWISIGLSGNESTNVYKKTTTGTSLSISTSILPAGQIYTWAIGATDGAGNVVWSVYRHFSIVKEHAILLLSPYNGETTSIPMLTWSSYTGADSYLVMVFDTYNNLVYSNLTILALDVVPVGKLTFGQKYYWMVGATKGKYVLASSDAGYFYYGY